MVASKYFLFLSNGHGEDLIATCLIKALKQEMPEACCIGFPLVGVGKSYEGVADEICGTRVSLPSGGFINRNRAGLWMDLRAGLVQTTLRQIQSLRSLTQIGPNPSEASPPANPLEDKPGRTLWQGWDDVVACGDMIPLLFGALFAKRSLFYLPTAKSAYIAPHLQIEKWLMRRFCKMVFPRDDYTSQNLLAAGVPVQSVGNVMMDALEITGCSFRSAASKQDTSPPQSLEQAPDLGGAEKTIAFLPGSHWDAYENMVDFMDIAIALEAETQPAGRTTEQRFTYLLSLAPSLSLKELEDFLLYRRQPEQCHPMLQCHTAHRSSLDNGRGVVAELILSERVSMKMIQGCFGDILASADIVIGLSGTGNEQAVGLGKPVIAYPSPRGTQFNDKFSREQKRLLGAGLQLVPSAKEVPARVEKLLSNAPLLEKIRLLGKERMGAPGAAGKIAKTLLEM